MEQYQLEKARKRVRIMISFLLLFLIAGLWFTRGQPIVPRLVGTTVNLSFTAWCIYLLRKTKDRTTD